MAADMLSMARLKDRAELVIRRYIDVDNVCVLLQLAYQHNAAVLLQDAVGCAAQLRGGERHTGLCGYADRTTGALCTDDGAAG